MVREPTFEEYKKAVKLERYAQRISSIILILTWIALVILIICMITYLGIIKNNPLEYGAKKENVSCNCYNYKEGIAFSVGKTSNIIETNYSNIQINSLS